MRCRRVLVASVGATLACVGAAAPPAAAQDAKTAAAEERGASTRAPLSGSAEFRDANLGTRITECPQAGLRDPRTRPLDRREIDIVERLSRRGDDIRANQDFSCLPQDETSVAISPRFPDNWLTGANDYRLGTGSSGFYSSTNGGRGFYDGIIPFPSGPPAQTRGEGFVISGGDPVLAVDRDGIAYYSMISFFRGDDTNGIMVARSTNGGFTWSRACIPFGTTDAGATCTATQGDSRQPGDGRVTYFPDNDLFLNGSVPFDDKEWMTDGPRPRGVRPDCFAPITRTRVDCDPDVVGSDRLYVTWTRFFGEDSEIYMSYSDDQARSWSPAKAISGAAPFCVGTGNRCSNNQFSVPTVSPETGALYVAFQNFNTPDENQYLMVRSRDGGQTFEGPFFVTPVYDVNFPRAGTGPGTNRPDCAQRGQQEGRIVYTNSCFRSNAGGNIVVDERGGRFADDLYLVMSDNRNGTMASSNADIFLFKSVNGGSTWIGPTRVNDDRSVAPPNRDDPTATGDFGADQWWPWADIGRGGTLAIGFNDRRLDRDSTAHEWPTSRQRPGNYLVWFWGAGCHVAHADSRECLADRAATIPQPTAPVDPGGGPQPGQGAAYLGDFDNQQVSDVPSNYDYSFRAGIFAGDYNNVAVLPGGRERALGMWTDARNGRSSRNQAGRNPICEQSDVFLDTFDPLGRGGGSGVPLDPFLVTACPGDAVSPRQGD